MAYTENPETALTPRARKIKPLSISLNNPSPPSNSSAKFSHCPCHLSETPKSVVSIYRSVLSDRKLLKLKTAGLMRLVGRRGTILGVPVRTIPEASSGSQSTDDLNFKAAFCFPANVLRLYDNTGSVCRSSSFLFPLFTSFSLVRFFNLHTGRIGAGPTKRR